MPAALAGMDGTPSQYSSRKVPVSSAKTQPPTSRKRSSSDDGIRLFRVGIAAPEQGASPHDTDDDGERIAIAEIAGDADQGITAHKNNRTADQAGRKPITPPPKHQQQPRRGQQIAPVPEQRRLGGAADEIVDLLRPTAGRWRQSQ